MKRRLTSGWNGVVAGAAFLCPGVAEGGPSIATAGVNQAPAAQVSQLQSIQTVFVILMENQNWSSIKGSTSAPYINHTLLPMASHAEQYYNPPGLHPSLPNYLWLEAGTNFSIFDDSDPGINHQSTTNHLVALLKRAGISWTSYQEDISGSACPLTAVNLYAPKHNPMVYFDDVTNTNKPGSAYCIANVRPYSELAGDLRSNVVTRYNFITPNLCDDMHNSTGCATTNAIKNGDTWLSTNVPAILNSRAWSNNGALFILWDEAVAGDGPIGMIVLSPLAKGGGYSNSIPYTHSSTLRTIQEIFNLTPLLGDAANASNLSDLFAAPAQLVVNPLSGFSSSGPVGGPFSPATQTYTLSNSGGTTMGWTASRTANWLALSASAGTLARGSNTIVTVSLTTNANSLPTNTYSATIAFTNTINGAGNTNRSANLVVISPNPAGFGFYDDFSVFAPGYLVGQSNWTQLGTISSQPLQVSGGKVTIPSAQTADNQDAYKNFTKTNGTVFYGLTLTVNDASANASPPYFAALYPSNNAGGSAVFRLTAKAGNAARTNFVFGVRVIGQGSDPYTFGAAGLSTGAQYRVVVQARAGGTNVLIYVNPASSNLNALTPYTSNSIGNGAPASVGSFVLSQSGTMSVPGDGVSIGKVVLADTFATVFNALGPPPRIASFTASPGSGPAPLVVTFTDTSTGNITNRLWSFGDGVITNTTTNRVVHTYAAGTYTVMLVVTGGGGSSTNTQPNSITALSPFQSWQNQYFGSITNPAAAPGADPDGDGQSNQAEFQVGTNPTNRASAFRFTAISREGNNIRVNWTMGSGRTNALQRARGGAGGGLSTNFSDLVTIITVGSATNYLDLGAATNARALYYRLRLVPFY